MSYAAGILANKVGNSVSRQWRGRQVVGHKPVIGGEDEEFQEIPGILEHIMDASGTVTVTFEKRCFGS